MIAREINGRTVTFVDRDPHYSHILFTCPDCGTYTFLTVAGGNLNECADDCPNSPRLAPYPDYELRCFAEVENGTKTARQLSGSPEPTGPDPDGFYRRDNGWMRGTSERHSEIFVPGTGWVKS